MLKGKKREVPFITSPKPDAIKSSSSECDYIFKIHIIGDSGVGKSSLLLRFGHDTYTEGYLSTIGFDFIVRDIEIDQKIIRTQVWDAPSKEKFRSITSAYYRGAHAAIAVFDLTDGASFNHVKDWINDYREKKSSKANLILVGTKSDLYKTRVVSDEKIKEFMQKSKYPIDAYIETSSKTGENVDKAFQTAAEIVFNSIAPKVNKPDPTDKKRQELIEGLQKYINRIKSYKDIHNSEKLDFSYGFRFFKSSQAINREANYHLAKILLKKLEKTKESITSIFEHIEEKRNTIIKEKELFLKPHFKNRGINSDELNTLINSARMIR